MWWIIALIGGIVACVLISFGFIIAVTKAETGETWKECTKRFLKGFFRGNTE